MKKTVLVILCLTFVGCAPPAVISLKPTQVNERLEMCRNARDAFIDGSSRLQTPLGGTESDYWVQYKQGAKAAIAIYCLN